METEKVLARFMPHLAAPIIAKWIAYFKCEFVISKSRASKFGDYRHPYGLHKQHRISVNNDLNNYAFLVTTVHEFAHLFTYVQHKNKVKPHGQEWKFNFKRMMQPFFEQAIFPKDIEWALKKYLENPAASSCADKNLYAILLNYNAPKIGLLKVEQLSPNTPFLFRKKVFIKGEKQRTRIRCTEKQTGKIYLFNPLTEVKLSQN